MKPCKSNHSVRNLLQHFRVFANMARGFEYKLTKTSSQGPTLSARRGTGLLTFRQTFSASDLNSKKLFTNPITGAKGQITDQSVM